MTLSAATHSPPGHSWRASPLSPCRCKSHRHRAPFIHRLILKNLSVVLSILL
jgi:hypothetical protein